MRSSAKMPNVTAPQMRHDIAAPSSQPALWNTVGSARQPTPTDDLTTKKYSEAKSAFGTPPLSLDDAIGAI